MDKIFYDLIPAMTSLSCDIGSFTDVQYVDSRTTAWTIFDKDIENGTGTYYTFSNTGSNSVVREFTFKESTNIYVIKTVSRGHITSSDENEPKGLIELYTFKNNQYTKNVELYQRQKDVGNEYNTFIVKATDITKFKLVSHSVLFSVTTTTSYAMSVLEVYLYGRK